MKNQTFKVEACWDPEAKIYYAKSDIKGLHIEADNFDSFEKVLFEVAPELIITNHISAEEFSRTPLKNLVPGILWQRPEKEMACA